MIASLQDSPSRGRELPLDGSSAILRMFVERPGEQGGSEGRGAPLGRGRRHLEFYIHQLVERVLNPIVGIVGAPQLRSEEYTSELQSLMRISYAVFCLKKKNKK